MTEGDGRRYLTLSDVSRRTGRHPEQLRQWCASGRLPCHRIGRDWLLGAEDLELVDTVATRRRRRGPRLPRVVLAASFTDADTGRQALARVAAELALGPRDLGIAPLAIDDVSFSLVAVALPLERVTEATSLLEGFGGRIVAEVEERTDGRGRAASSPSGRVDGAAGA